MADKEAVEITDISDTPDIAVWAKGIRKNLNKPSDKVKEPSKITSMTLHFKTSKNREFLVDPANEQEVAKVLLSEQNSLTDESDYGK